MSNQSASTTQSAAPAGRCETLATSRWPNVTITRAQFIAAGQFALPDAGRGDRSSGPAGVLPRRGEADADGDSDIKIEVWVPATGWNGKFVAVGKRRLRGSHQRTGRCRSPAAIAAAALATASTDGGHSGADEKPGRSGILKRSSTSAGVPCTR